MKRSDLAQCLSVIVRDTDLHARWLNTFSLLEYIGFRKIVKSQAEESLTVEVLNHALEEGRHALRLKRLALKVGGKSYDSFETSVLFCREEAVAYFQGLDESCAKILEGFTEQSRLNYLYVTWLVEERAIEVYKCYAQVTGEKFPQVLRGLLQEEAAHLEAVQSHIISMDSRFIERSLTLKKVEKELFEKYFKALRREVSQEPLAHHA